MKLKDIHYIGDWISDPCAKATFEDCVLDLVIIQEIPMEFFHNAAVDARERIKELFKVSDGKIEEMIILIELGMTDDGEESE